MKRRSLFILSLTPLVLAGCNKQNQKKKPVDPERTDKGNVVLHLQGMANPERTSPYEIKVEFDDACFAHSAAEFDKTLELMSFAGSCVGGNIQLAETFYSGMYFGNFYHYGYETTSKHSVAYTFATKSMEEYDVIAVTIRGDNYGKEWANNFDIGKTGNHYGFSLRATEIFYDLVRYVNNSIEEGRDIKVWTTGYSRAGGISNVLSDLIMREAPFSLGESNLFTYTFEAPAGISQANKVEYPNVFNIINSRDIVTRIPPVEYGFVRCGTDVDIFVDNFEEVIHNFDEDIPVPAFTPNNAKYKNELEFINWFKSGLLVNTDDASASLSTRGNYVDNYQDHISYLMLFYFSLPQETVMHIKEALESLEGIEFLILLSEDGIYNKISPILDRDGVSYDETKLKAATNKITAFMNNHLDLIMKFVGASGISEEMANNLGRILLMHYPEMTYALITNE